MSLRLQVVTAILAAAVASAVAMVVSSALPSSSPLLGLAVVGVLGFLLGVTIVRLRDGRWFAPLGFPLLFAAASFGLPLAYVALTGEDLGFLTSANATPEVVAVLTLFVGAMAAGMVLVARAVPARGGLSVEAAAEVNWPRIGFLGRILVAGAVVVRAAIVSQTPATPYGVGQFEDLVGLQATVDRVAATMLFVGIVVVAMHNVRIRGRLLEPIDLALLAAFAIPTLVAGVRGDLIAPLLALIVIRHTCIKPLRGGTAVVGVLLALVLLQGVSGAREGRPFFEGYESASTRLLNGLSSQVFVTAKTVDVIPDTHPFEEGSTYATSIQRQLPSPVTSPVLGEPDDVADFVFRDAIGFTNLNFGFGFAYPAEAYMNFGVPGVAVLSLLLGALLGLAYTRHRLPASSASQALYLVLLATLPFAIRSNALVGIKTVLYSMVLLALVYWLAGKSSRERPTGRPSP